MSDAPAQKLATTPGSTLAIMRSDHVTLRVPNFESLLYQLGKKKCGMCL